MKKVLIFSSTLNAGGAERVTTCIAAELANRGYRVAIVTGTKKQTYFYDIPKKVITISQQYQYEENVTKTEKAFRFAKRVLDTRELIKRESPDTIICMKWEVSFRCALAAAGLNVNKVLSEHNHYFALKNRFIRIFRNFLYFSLSDSITVLTQRDKLNYPQWLSTKISVMENPLGIDGISYDLKPQHERKVMLSIGRFTRQKGFDRLLSIFAKFQEKDSSWTLRIIGQGKDFQDIKKIAHNLGISHNVEFPGLIKDIEKEYLNSSIFLMTSRWEGLPMVLGEAMSFALPIIAYDCPTGPSEFIDNDINGILVEDGNSDAYLDKLIQIASSEELRMRLSANALLKSNCWRISEIADKWEPLL